MQQVGIEFLFLDDLVDGRGIIGFCIAGSMVRARSLPIFRKLSRKPGTSSTHNLETRPPNLHSLREKRSRALSCGSVALNLTEDHRGL